MNPVLRQRKCSSFLPTETMEVSAMTPKIQVPVSHSTLLSYDEMPEWYQDNEFILHKYRPISNSTYECFSSWLSWHNETVNIHSHLIPAIMFLAAEGFISTYLQSKYPGMTVFDHLIFAAFLLSAVICLGLSATYHTMSNHSCKLSSIWLQFDFVGIIVLTLGDFVSGIYMAFYCEPTLQQAYWASVRMNGAWNLDHPHKFLPLTFSM